MLTLALFPIAGQAATEVSEDAGTTQSETSVVVTRSIEAGQEVSKRALSSKENQPPKATTQDEAASAELTDFQKKIAALAQGEVPAAAEKKTSATAATMKTASKGAAAVAAQVVSAVQKKLAGPEKVPGKLVSKEGETASAGKGAAARSLSSLEKKSSEEKEPMTTKTVAGTLCSKSSRGIGLVYGMDKKANAELEMWIPFSEKVDLQGYQTIAEIAAGDDVSVTYEETAEGGFKRAVKSMKLVKKPSNEENPYYLGEATP